MEPADGPIHFGVSRGIKRQTMLVGINTSGETLCPLTATTDRSTTGVFRDAIEKGFDLKVQIARSAYIDATIFHDYLEDVLIPKLKNSGKQASCPTNPHPSDEQLLGAHFPCDNSIAFTAPRENNYFSPHTSGIFQILDLLSSAYLSV
jgi:hypothetical protein